MAMQSQLLIPSKQQLSLLLIRRLQLVLKAFKWMVWIHWLFIKLLQKLPKEDAAAKEQP
ncbi:hypothetical protein D3C79_1025660 [compost metagenome]